MRQCILQESRGGHYGPVVLQEDSAIERNIVLIFLDGYDFNFLGEIGTQVSSLLWKQNSTEHRILSIAQRIPLEASCSPSLHHALFQFICRPKEAKNLTPLQKNMRLNSIMEQRKKGKKKNINGTPLLLYREVGIRHKARGETTIKQKHKVSDIFK